MEERVVCCWCLVQNLGFCIGVAPEILTDRGYTYYGMVQGKTQWDQAKSVECHHIALL
jgi:hypothetical protein